MVKKFYCFFENLLPNSPSTFSFSSLLLYFFSANFIVGWWLLALHPTASPSSFSIKTPQTLALKTSALFEELSPLQREDIQRALAGDFPTLLHLIDQWDQDALQLGGNGVPQIERLSIETSLQAHVLGRLIQNSSGASLHALNCKMNLEWIRDDNERLLRIEDHFQYFLPQTYLSACFLLAIADPREIIALPKGLRLLHQLYPPDTFKQIPADIGQMHSERLSLNKPDLAFIAPYSHPPALEALRNQQIELYSIKHVNTLPEIQQALLKVGHASNHILEAQLLTIFIEACMISIDNRFRALNKKYDSPPLPLKLLYLSHRQNYTLPTAKSLTGQLMARALTHCPHLCSTIPTTQDEWRIPFGQENILESAPDLMIISTHQPPESILDPAMQETNAFKSKQIFYIDETLQESPTQHIALAYFDIFQVLAAADSL